MKSSSIELSSLSRPIDFSYSSNVFAIAAAVASFLIGLGVGAARLDDPELLEIVWYGINVGGASFLGWAIARELDPDHAGSALVAAISAPALVIALNQIPQLEGLLAGGLIMQTTRFLSRSTGVKLYITDALAIIVVAGIVAASDLWLIGLAVALAFWADGVLADPNPRSRIYAGITLIVVLVIAGLTDQFKFDGAFMDREFLVGLTVALVAFSIIPRIPDTLASKTDITGEPLHKARVVYSINVMLIALILICLATNDAVLKLTPLWAALIGMIVFRAYDAVAGKR